MSNLGLKGKACLVQLISAPVFIVLAWWVHSSSLTLSQEAIAARKMLLFEGIGQVFLAVAAWNDKTRPNTKEFKDDFKGWARSSVVVRCCSVAAMTSFFVQVTAGRLELTLLALGAAVSSGAATGVKVLLAFISVLIAASTFLKWVPLLGVIIVCFLFGPIAAGIAQGWVAQNTLLAASQFLYIASFPLVAARLVTRWQGEVLNFIGWFVLARAVVPANEWLG